MDDLRWYAVRTFPSYEQKVIDKLVKQIKIEHKEEIVTEIYLPVQYKYEFVRNKLKKKESFPYPGYIFVKMEQTEDAYYFVRGIQYVTGYAGISSMKQTPKPINDSEFDTMKEQTSEIIINLNIGDNVSVVDHELYDDHVATIEAIYPETEEVDVSIDNKESNLRLKFDQITNK
ncbi:MAG: transcription termination/antitermination protein NusG [Mycoplasmatales bacterium]